MKDEKLTKLKKKSLKFTTLRPTQEKLKGMIWNTNPTK
jgi:hypothetical protein